MRKTAMNKRAMTWSLMAASAVCLGLAAMPGCELLVDFDRSKIPQEGGLQDVTLSDSPSNNDVATGGDSPADSPTGSDGGTDSPSGEGGGPDSASDAPHEGSTTADTGSDAPADTGGGGTDASDGATDDGSDGATTD
jgi:hypothetical protein